MTDKEQREFEIWCKLRDNAQRPMAWWEYITTLLFLGIVIGIFAIGAWDVTRFLMNLLPQ